MATRTEICFVVIASLTAFFRDVAAATNTITNPCVLGIQLQQAEAPLSLTGQECHPSAKGVTYFFDVSHVFRVFMYGCMGVGVVAVVCGVCVCVCV